MTIHLGLVRQNEKITIHRILDFDKEVSSVEPSCGCMSVSFNKKNNTILMTYNTGKISPYALESQGFQTINKYLVVHFVDGTNEKIKIEGKIKP